MDRKVISDTSCLIALDNVNRLDLLRDLYQEILTTKEFHREFGKNLPSWFLVSGVKNLKKQVSLEKQLDIGEASCITPALETQNSTLIIDEIKGRKIAESLEIDIIGTIGVLIVVMKQNLINDFLEILSKLVENGFRISDDLMTSLIDRFGHH